MKINVLNTLDPSATEREIFQRVLGGRGYATPEKMEEYLRPPEPTLDYVLAHIDVDQKELKKAKECINQAIKNGSDMCVYGDYDADGITASAILWQSLRLLAQESSARIMPFIPERARHGYGLSTQAVEDILSGYAFRDSLHPDFRPTLIITVDNGIVANEAIADLIGKGIEVIITDHHQMGKVAPAPTALIHSTATSGAGIAWLTSLYLADSREEVSDMIELACVGIVADQIELKGVNRSIVKAGLVKLSETKNPGIVAMLATAGITGKKLSTYEINYVLAPRLNAVGRLDKPITALRLLCSPNTKLTKSLAEEIESHNTHRQELTEQSISEAMAEKVDHKIVVSASPDFHEGIIGLVAGKLAESHNRPAIAISMGEKISKGSARSIGEINITNILRKYSKLLLGVGGHKLAAGFSLETKNIEKLKKAVYKYADENIHDQDLEKSFTVEGVLQLAQVTMPLTKLLVTLEPFGLGNPRPRFVAYNLMVLEDRIIGKNGNHRKLVVEQDGTTRDVLWWNSQAAHPLKSLSTLVFTPEINTWKDRESLQLSAQYVESN